MINFNNIVKPNIKILSDLELEQALKDKVATETLLKIEILHLLAEVERRRLYSKTYPSLFEYCVKTLKYSSSAAQRRIDTMRAMKLIPEIEEKLLTGELNLSSVSMAQSFFRNEIKSGKTVTVADKIEILEKLENKSTRDCLKELVKISPQSITQEKRRELTESKTELKVILDKDLIEKLDKLKSFLSHSNPNMTDAELIRKVANIALEKLDPSLQRIKKTKKNENSKTDLNLEVGSKRIKTNCMEDKIIKAKESSLKLSSVNEPTDKCQAKTALPAPALRVLSPKRYIPVSIKREVYLRDKGCCTFVNSTTNSSVKATCGSRHLLEYDHVEPVALGGETSAKNLRLLCKAHNLQAAINVFGVAKIQSHILK